MVSILDQIPKKEVKTDRESLVLYRLGLFGNSMFELVELDSNQVYDSHIHHNSESKLFVVVGEGVINLDGNEKEYKSGDEFLVTKGMSHGFKPKTQTLMLSINTPPILDPENEEMDFEYVEKESDN